MLLSPIFSESGKPVDLEISPLSPLINHVDLMQPGFTYVPRVVITDKLKSYVRRVGRYRNCLFSLGEAKRCGHNGRRRRRTAVTRM
jgi:hypothetical protein